MEALVLSPLSHLPLSLGFIALYYFMLSFNSIRIMRIVFDAEEEKLRLWTQTYVPKDRERLNNNNK